MTEKTDDVQFVHSEELSAEAHFALWYSLAIIGGPTSKAHKLFAQKEAEVNLTKRDKLDALARGLAELRERGLLDCEKDGNGDLVPKVLHLERFVPGSLVLSELN